MILAFAGPSIMTANTPQSRKQKGMKFQGQIKQMILEHFPDLEEDDIVSRSSGAGGVDLHLSPKAHKLVPLDIEAKNQETTKVWEWWKQTITNATYTPCLVFKRSRQEPLAILKFEDLLEILKGKE